MNRSSDQLTLRNNDDTARDRQTGFNVILWRSFHPKRLTHKKKKSCFAFLFLIFIINFYYIILLFMVTAMSYAIHARPVSKCNPNPANVIL